MKQKLRASAAQEAASKRSVKGTAAVEKKTPGRSSNAAKKRQPLRKPASTRQTLVKKAEANEETIREFRVIVNLDVEQLKRWLETPQSKKLERLSEYGETGTAAGRSVLQIVGKRRDKYTSDDLKQMRIIIDHINRRLAKRPKGDIIASNWRYSLMNWGHDPTKRPRRVSK